MDFVGRKCSPIEVPNEKLQAKEFANKENKCGMSLEKPNPTNRATFTLLRTSKIVEYANYVEELN